MAYHKNSIQQSVNSTNIADLLERVLDKGIVIVGDINIKLVEVEFLSIHIQLVVCSVDRAKEMGIDWWNQHPPTLPHRHKSAVRNITNNTNDTTTTDKSLVDSIEQLNCRIASLEKQLANYTARRTNPVDTDTKQEAEQKPATSAVISDVTQKT